MIRLFDCYLYSLRYNGKPHLTHDSNEYEFKETDVIFVVKDEPQIMPNNYCKVEDIKLTKD